MESGESTEPVDELIRIHYLKSPAFRSVHVDGVYVGPTPSNKVTLSFFSERYPIPQETVHVFDVARKIGDEVGRTAREGIVRELEVNMIMDIEIAERIGKFIQEQVAQVRALQGGEP